jgi:hypothetical protein
MITTQQIGIRSCTKFGVRLLKNWEHLLLTKVMNMLFNEQQLNSMISMLFMKTINNEVHWEAGGNRYYTSLLPNMVFAISTASIPDPNAGSVAYQTPPIPAKLYRVRILANENDVLGETEAPPSSNNYTQAKQLYEQIESSISRKLFSQIQQVLSQPGIVGEPAGRSSALPSVDQQKAVLAKMKGKWKVEGPSGTEVATIDDSGNYTVDGYNENPKFILTVIACNDMLSKVEIAKDHLNGKRHHIEVLNLTPDQLIGVAKQDQRKIKYSRV